MNRISVVINTLNEEANIANALRSVCTWADELVVVDMHSTDRTCTIAKDLGAKVYDYKRVGYVEPARAYAVAQTTNDWVLILDADEMVVPSLSQALRRIAADDEADVVVIPRLNYDLGTPMMHSGSGPDQDKQTRFFKKGYLEISDQIHSGLNPKEGARVLKLRFSEGGYLAHFGILDLTAYLEKMVRYTGVEATQKFMRGQRSSTLKMLWSTVKVFGSRYVLYAGFMDGWRGFYRALFLVVYRVATHAKLMQLEHAGDERVVRQRCDSLVAQILDGYKIKQ